MIDAHVHFWQFDSVRDAWITDEMAVIRKDFLPENWKRATRFFSPEGCIAVQADQSRTETAFLCGLAQNYSFVKAVVGWVDLRAVDLEAQLQDYKSHVMLKGFRHIAQGETDNFLAQKEIMSSIYMLHKYAYTFDILVYHYQLPAVITLIKHAPKNQKFIIDHCAKPAISNADIDTWASDMKTLAKHENVYCKVSGLFTEAVYNNWKTTDFFPYLKCVFELFGEERVVFGSDWPVINLSGDFVVWVDVLHQYFEQNPLKNPKGFWQENAEYFYDIS